MSTPDSLMSRSWCAKSFWARPNCHGVGAPCIQHTSQCREAEGVSNWRHIPSPLARDIGAVRQPSSQGILLGSCREQTSSQGGPLVLRHPFTPVSHGIEAASCKEDGILTGNVSPDFAAPPLRRYRAAEVPIGVDGGRKASNLTGGNHPRRCDTPFFAAIARHRC